MFSAEEGQKTSGSYKYKIRRPAKSLRIGSFLLFMLFLFKYAWVLRGQRQVSSIQAATSASLGMRQSPRGERLTDPTLGPSGRQLRLNCCEKNLP